MISGAQIWSDSVSFRWSESTDNVGVAGYTFFRNGQEILGEDIIDYFETYADVEVPTGQAAWIQVQAFDAAGNVSAKSSPLRIAVDSRRANAPVLLDAVWNPETLCIDITFQTTDWRGTWGSSLISNRYPYNGGRIPDFSFTGVEPFDASEPGPIQLVASCFLLEPGRHYLQMTSNRVSGESVKTWPFVIEIPEIPLPTPPAKPPTGITAQVVVQPNGVYRSVHVRWDEPGPGVDSILARWTTPRANGGKSGSPSDDSIRFGLGDSRIEAPYAVKLLSIDRFDQRSEFSEEVVLDPRAQAPAPAGDFEAVYDAATGCIAISFVVSADAQNIDEYRVVWGWGGSVVATLPGSSASVAEPRREAEVCDLASGRRYVYLETSFDDGPAAASSDSFVFDVGPG